jgi:hypothetical protein
MSTFVTSAKLQHSSCQAIKQSETKAAWVVLIAQRTRGIRWIFEGSSLKSRHSAKLESPTMYAVANRCGLKETEGKQGGAQFVCAVRTFQYMHTCLCVCVCVHVPFSTCACVWVCMFHLVHAHAFVCVRLCVPLHKCACFCVCFTCLSKWGCVCTIVCKCACTNACVVSFYVHAKSNWIAYLEAQWGCTCNQRKVGQWIWEYR